MAITRGKRKTAPSSEQTADPKKNKPTIPKSSTVNNNPFPTFADKKNGEGFTALDYSFLSSNDIYRYMPSGKNRKVGHAVILKDKAGEEIALQYDIPVPQSTSLPPVMPLQNIEKITRFGLTRYQAETLDHTPMYAKRYLRAKVGKAGEEEEMDIAYFSPAEKEGKEPFWGDGDKETALFRDDLTSEEKAELAAEMAEKEVKIKGGEEVHVEYDSVRYRDLHNKRGPSQNRVMGTSAKDAYEAFLTSLEDELSPKMKEILKRAVDAPLHSFYSNYRPEWLHAEGFSLSPMNHDPQNEENLGAAPKWANTEMMVLERIAKWFALNAPQAYVKIKPEFEMLLDSELIKKINFEVSVKDKKNWIKLLQEINPFKKYPLFRKASDVAQGTAITYNLLNDVAPSSEQKIISTQDKKTLLRAKVPPTKSSKSPSAQPARSQPSFFTKRQDPHMFPTHFAYEKSIVQVSTTANEPDYDEPWLGAHLVYSTGTGLVISQKGKKYILTNAHCVENALYVKIRLANQRTQTYEAKPKCVSYQCDLALLEVEDPEFQKIAEPVKMGEMVSLQDGVQTVGFPMGGNEISISNGIVSRIEVRDYVMSELNMLQVQIDAAVNPGNSGGPVFSNGKVVGVAFQGYDKQGLGYMIPIPIINHFVNEALNGKEYRGFPELPIGIQCLANPALREYHGMTRNQSGIRVTKIDYLSDAYHKLKKGDILLEIDSKPISNDATVEIPGIGNCIDFIHVTQMKYIGDTVKLKVLRKNEETQKPEILNISVILDHVPLETNKVPQAEHDKMPTYYIASGISFTPLSRNYLNGKGSSFEDYFFVEEGSSLINMPKKYPDEQIVVVNDILNCDATQGYESYENCIVKEVNGRKIRNIHDVIDAIENNKEPMHHIKTALGNVIVVKNMSKKEHDALLDLYEIHRDRSKDLLSTQSAKEEQFITAEESLGSQSEYDENMEIEETEGLSASVEKDLAGPMPGQQRFFNTLRNLEKRYAPKEEKTEDLFSSNEEKDKPLPSDSQEDVGFSSEAESFTTSSNKRPFNLVQLPQRHRLFQLHDAVSDQKTPEPPTKKYKP